MEQALQISPFLILLAGLVFHATSHLNCGPEKTPRYYIPLVYVLLITISFHLNNRKRNQNRSKLLLKSARCEIPDNINLELNNFINDNSSFITSSLHLKTISRIDKALMNLKVTMLLNLSPYELKDKWKLKTVF